MSSSVDSVVRPPIFREYIGVGPRLDHFPVEDSHVNEFHFILGIATEKYVDGKGTGHFTRSWDYVAFSPERVRILKERFTNVKVIISIGGLGTDQPFNPAEESTDQWIAVAVRSIRGIIHDYKLIDGIDINYEHISSSEEVFSSCIGNLITQLKNDNDPALSIKVVSIAPTDFVKNYYSHLYWANEENINWVNYKFYKQNVPSTEEFVRLYRELASNQYFPGNKILPGASTDPHHANMMPQDVFIDGIIELHSKKLLPGAFVWNANYSQTPSNPGLRPFFLEKVIQAILTSP